MVIDKNKGILAIHYNHLNLPTEIIFQDNNRIKYFYDAAGTKRRKEVYTEGIKSSVQDYAGSVVYRDDAVSFALFEEGRVLINPEEPNYIEYHLKDHLGNVRVAYKEDNGLPLALQTNTYYPFGMLISELSTPVINCPNPLKYNAKELQPDFGLDWYDYGARFYDPQVGRWWGVDPLADQRSWVSPYSYCQNSPMNRVDPTGALDDWYQSEAGNVVWREGDAETITVNGEEFKNIGTSYTTTVIGGDALIHYDQDKPTVIVLTTDVGKKYSMIAAEGGWIKQDGETKRETEYGLLLISASMENRLNNPKFFPNKGTYESLFTPSQYNAANSRTYKNIASQIPTWESWYGTADVMSYLDAVFKASHGSAVSTLQTDYKFANADKILGYAHNNSNLFGKYSINLGFDKTNTLIKTLQSSSVVFPTLK